MCQASTLPLLPTPAPSKLLPSCFPGLTRLHEETLDLEPGVTTGWELSDDGLVYTFNLIEGIPWVWYNPDTDSVEEVLDDDGNVRILTAHDFVYGIRRTLDPITAGDYAYVLALGGLENGEAVNAGEMELDAVGVQALDDLTLQVTVPEPAAFVPNILGLWMASAQPQWLIEQEGDFWTEAGIIQSYGPFALKEWNHGENILIIRNPFWAGTDTIPAPVLDGVNFNMLEESAQLANFEAGTLDVSCLPCKRSGSGAE